MLARSTDHFVSLRNSIAAANYKLRYSPSIENLVLGEKNFASKFVVEALNELKNATNHIDSEINEIEDIISKKNKQNNIFFQISTSILALIGIAVGYWFLKSK